MADRDDARPEFNPKHRIIGAIIIVALVVVFVPMILSERQPPSESKGVSEMTPRGAAVDTRVVVTPVVAEEPRASDVNPVAKSVTPAPVIEAAPKPEIKPAVPAEKPVPAKKTPAAPTKEHSVTASAATEKPAKGWAVQVGTFSNTENAIHLRDKLKRHGHAVHSETVTLAGKKAIRLRIGPFRDKEQAVKVQAQIRKELRVQGVVLAYP